jgi:hypothetical protein
MTRDEALALGKAYAETVVGCTPERIERAQRYQLWLLEGKPTVTSGARAADWSPDFKAAETRTS